MERHRVGIVIPALNEAPTIASVVRGVKCFGMPVVVDDGSTDGTAAIAKASGADVIQVNGTIGYDRAINLGFEYAERIGCEYVITIDADGQHDGNVLPDFIEALNTGADLVIGVRDRRQRLAEHVFSWVAAWKWGIHDPLSGFKGYRMSAYRMQGYFDSYTSIGTQLVVHAAKKGKKIVHIRAKTANRVGKSRFGRFSANAKIFRSLWIAIYK